MEAISRHQVRRGRARPLAIPPTPGGLSPLVVPLAGPEAADPPLAGRKAAVLASATALGFPVLPGFVVTTAGCAAISAAGGAARLPDGVRSALEVSWAALSDHGRRTLVVRSSSPGEDGATSSMAGQFTSVLGVKGLEAFLAAVDRVIASGPAGHPAEGGDEPAPMAVLVQPQVYPRWGGVLFGVDPVTGRRDRLALAAVDGGPDQLVSGTVEGSRAILTRRGRLLAIEGDGPRLPARQRRSLARLAARARDAFGSPQDIEWALDPVHGLLLLQSRPVTAVGVAADARGPVLGPGPVAETFPDPLAPLEVDLWLEPLKVALGHAVLLTGAAARRRVSASPVVTSVEGWAAADLELLGIATGKRSFWARFDPRPPGRRLVAAWRTGRLRVALPGLASDLVAHADKELSTVGAPHALSDTELVRVLKGSYQALVSLNAHEILAGMLSPVPAEAEGGGATSAGAALHVVAAARAGGLSDDEILARYPVVLSLVPPAIGSHTVLPDLLVLPPADGDGGAAHPLTVWREALRLRVRWVQELTSVVAAELGARLARRDLIPDAEAVRWLRLPELEDAVGAGLVPDDVPTRRARPQPAPLPAAFQLGPGGAVVPVAVRNREGSQGAGGGRAVGRVVHSGDLAPERGAVLVTRTLDPALAPLLPGLGGLVAETGSVLSHLAILAREFGVPTVVGVTDALDRFPAGSVVVVDGTTGEVTPVETAGAA